MIRTCLAPLPLAFAAPAEEPFPRLSCGCRPGDPARRCRYARELRRGRDAALLRAEKLPKGGRERREAFLMHHCWCLKLAAHLRGEQDR